MGTVRLFPQILNGSPEIFPPRLYCFFFPPKCEVHFFLDPLSKIANPSLPCGTFHFVLFFEWSARSSFLSVDSFSGVVYIPLPYNAVLVYERFFMSRPVCSPGPVICLRYILPQADLETLCESWCSQFLLVFKGVPFSGSCSSSLARRWALPFPLRTSIRLFAFG